MRRIGPVLCLALLGVSGCVSAPPVAKASLRQAWPGAPAPDLLAYAPAADDYPSVGGDILRGASPARLAEIRAAAAASPAPPAPR